MMPKNRSQLDVDVSRAARRAARARHPKRRRHIRAVGSRFGSPMTVERHTAPDDAMEESVRVRTACTWFCHLRRRGSTSRWSAADGTGEGCRRAPIASGDGVGASRRSSTGCPNRRDRQPRRRSAARSRFDARGVDFKNRACMPDSRCRPAFAAPAAASTCVRESEDRETVELIGQQRHRSNVARSTSA